MCSVLQVGTGELATSWCVETGGTSVHLLAGFFTLVTKQEGEQERLELRMEWAAGKGNTEYVWGSH